jgi:hypothetical protein
MPPKDRDNATEVGDLTAVSAATATELCADINLGEEAAALLSEGKTPREYLSLLIEREHLVDAVKLLSRALPKHKAVCWACLCGREVAGPETPSVAVRAIEAAEAWVRTPDEDHRRAAMAAADASGLESPGGCAAFAAFVSEGSLAPPNVPIVPPADYLTAHAVSGAIMLAAVAGEPERATEKYRRFLDLGIGLAQGRQGGNDTKGEA